MVDDLVHVHAYYVQDIDKQWNADYNKQIFRIEIFISSCLLKPTYPPLHVPVYLNPWPSKKNDTPLHIHCSYIGHCSYIVHSPAERSVLRETVPEVLRTARGPGPRALLKISGTVSPNTDRPRPVNNMFIFS